MKYEEFKELLEEELKLLNATESEVQFITKEAESYYVTDYDADVHVYARNTLKYVRRQRI